MTRETRLILVSVCLALATVVSAVSSINVALPDIARATGASSTQLQWVVDAYSLAFAGLVLPAGALGDRIGRRRALLAGLTLFGGAAAVATTISSPTLLIVMRAIMGVGGALTMPSTLSIVSTTFTADALDKALVIWTGVAGASGLFGVLTAGVLLELFSWPSVFVLSVVLAALGIVMTLRFVPSGGVESVKLDTVGAVLAALGLVGIVWGIIEGPNLGWSSSPVLAGFIAGALLLVAFLVWEARAPAPMLDPRLFRLRGFSVGAASVFMQFFAVYGVIFLALQYFQFVLGYSPLAAGAAFVPFAAGIGAVGRRVPQLVRRVGLRSIGPAGLAIIALALILSALAGTVDASYPTLVPGILLLGIGMGMCGPPATSMILACLPKAKQGVASAVNDTAREVGGAIGIAIFGSILISQAGNIGRHVNLQNFVSGYDAALYVGAGLVLIAAILVALRAPARITLVVTEGPRAGDRISLNDPATLGRHADIVVDDPELSRRHVALRPVADGLEVEDLGSLNGTYVRGVRLGGSATVRDGAEIRVGQTAMTVKLPTPDSGATKMIAVRRPTVRPDLTAGGAPHPASSPAAPQPVTLHITAGTRSGERVELAGQLTIGRTEGDLLIADPELSRRHATLRPVLGGLEVEDHNSSNGTYVRGKRITRIETAGHADRVQLGHTTLVVEVHAER